MKNKLLLSFLAVMMIALQSYGQITVTGTVTSKDDGLGLIGATVSIKGTTTGVSTDIDGKYSIKAPDENATLVFSYVGLLNQEILVGKQTTIDVVLSANAAVMDEVVVIGYGTQKRSQITGAVSTITADEINQTPVLRPEQALQGRTAGVQVSQNSGSPGSALSVKIRGTGTIGNSDPLYVVDGVPVAGLDYLNPGDIETIQVLKDAASGAIYGARAANGVVLITTKTGKKNSKAVIEYDAYWGLQSVSRKINLLNAEEYAILSNEAHLASGQTPFAEFADPSSLGEGTDWQDAIFQDAPIQKHQVSIRGGSDKTTYSLVGNFFQQDGIVGGDKGRFRRGTFRIRGDHDVSDKLKVGTNLSYTHFTRDALAENNEFSTPLVHALNMDPVTTITKPDGTYNFSKYSDTDLRNPVNGIATTNSTWTNDRVLATAYGQYEIIEGLKLRSSYTMDLSFASANGFRPSFDLGAPNEQNLINSVSIEDHRWSTWLLENTLSYEKKFKDVHKISTVVGITAQENNYKYFGGGKSDLPTNNPDQALINLATDVESEGIYGGASDWALLSYLGRVNYSFDEKYLFSTTLRVDGSSRFGANNRYGIFPSFSAGWVVSSEEFMADVEAVNFLKLRASWGQNGNQEIGLYGFTSAVTSGLNYTFGTGENITNGSAPIVASNPDLKWETVAQTDIGIDMGLMQDKLMVSMDVFLKQTKDMLVTIPIPTHVGALPPTVNAGNVTNKGLELSAEYRDKIGDIKYNIGGNMTFLSNKVTSLGSGGEPINAGFLQSANGNISRTEVGHPIASFYGYVTDGLFQNEGDVASHATQSGAQPGDIRYRDLNQDGTIDENDQTFIGNPTPDFIYGITGGASWKGLDVQFFFQGTKGNDVYNGYTRYDFFYANSANTRLNRWTGEGTSDSEPRVTLTDPNQNARISDRFVEDGSYFRLKNMQIGYSFPKTITDKLQVGDIRFYVAGQNIFTTTKYTGLDPEIGARGSLELGIDRGFYPSARTYMTGVHVTF